MCKKFFEAYDQTILNFISLKNENENYEDNDDDLQEPHDSYDDVAVDGDFFPRNNQNNCVCRNDLDDFVEPDDIS